MRWWVAVIVLSCTVAALAGGFGFTFYGRPDPRTASFEALARWLATSDLAAEPPAVQDAFVDRLVDELRRPIDFAVAGEVSAAQREQLHANIETLKARWFLTRIDRHAALAGAERQAFLDEQIATLLAWQQISAALPTGDQPPSESGSAFFADIERWIAAEHHAARRARMQCAVSEGIVRWLAMHDLAEQPLAIRQRLALVVAGGLNSGVDAAAISGTQDSDEQARLRANGSLLLEAWLLAQAEAYAALSGAERAAFIDARIDEFTRWNIIALVSQADADAPPVAALAHFNRQFEAWIARAEPQQQAQLRALAADVQSRLMVRWLQALGRD